MMGSYTDCTYNIVFIDTSVSDILFVNRMLSEYIYASIRQLKLWRVWSVIPLQAISRANAFKLTHTGHREKYCPFYSTSTQQLIIQHPIRNKRWCWCNWTQIVGPECISSNYITIMDRRNLSLLRLSIYWRHLAECQKIAHILEI